MEITTSGSPLLIIGAAIVLVVLIFVLSGFKLIKDNQVGIPVRKMFSPKMPEGQVIAKAGQVGIQARILAPGLYWFFPFIWKILKKPITVIGQGQIGIVESIDGATITQGRLLANEVECKSFQDAVAFLFTEGTKGQKGPQIGILRPGSHRINTELFSVKTQNAIKIPENQLGVVIALDGKPLPPGYIIAPKPGDGDEEVSETVKKLDHNFFQNGQAFIDSGGYRGPQLDTLQPGEYYINPLLFRVQAYPIADVPPGFVAVLRSNVGKELGQSTLKPREVDPKATFDQAVHESEEVVLNTDQLTRGIWDNPVAPGKYNMNPVAFTAYLVPTSAVTIDWAESSEIRTGDPMHDDKAHQGPPAEHVAGTKKAGEFFKFSQLRVTSMDGFQLDVDVRMIIRIRPQHAAFVIARFGSVKNLIEQIVHPMIDSSFRNNAGEKKAIEFVQGRAKLQDEALKKAKTEFEKYHVEAQNLLIAYISVDKELLDTQTKKEIAEQQKAQYEQEALAQQKRIEVKRQTAIAEQQPNVVAAQLSIKIAEDNADAKRAEAAGDRDATSARADGVAHQECEIGKGKAAAYEAQASVVGAENLTVMRLFEVIGTSNIKVVPDFLVTGGGDGEKGGSALLMNAFLASIMAGKFTKPGAGIDLKLTPFVPAVKPSGTAPKKVEGSNEPPAETGESSVS